MCHSAKELKLRTSPYPTPRVHGEDRDVGREGEGETRVTGNNLHYPRGFDRANRIA